ncbi:hypothetical protein D3874_17640 [Oleomonas cavernae]|uniref:DUF2384 domain-containing protein n=1 Tax=Oleomonas cavernae TaxID=2320859 RepID=A0A418WEY9_9PROT|nr:hypothetical protein [Oleomonas cavernae]RJF88593.1 hypothetical protein D3874_17640 [Oleomonas cavernae]
MAGGHLLGGIIKWAQREEWREALAEALERHLGDACAENEVDFEELPELVGEHFVATLWGCAFEDFLTVEFDDGANIVDDYLKRRGWKETARIRDYLAALRRSVMSLYEVSDILPGQSFLARDLVRGGEPVRVSEVSATKAMRQWDRLAARLVTVGGKTIMGGGALRFEHRTATEVLDALAQLRRQAQEYIKNLAEEEGVAPQSAALGELLSGDASLAAAASLFTNIWLGALLDKVLGDAEPQLSNTDGDPLEFTIVRFPLAEGVSVVEIGDRLDDLPGLQPAGDQIWDWFDVGPVPSPAIQGVRYLSLNDSGATLHGSIELTGQTLTLRVNSIRRSDAGRLMLEQALPGLLGQAVTAPDVPDPASPGRPVTTGLSPEAEREIIWQTLDAHYRSVMDQPVAMIGNEAPREAVQTAEGRERVVAWLKYLENQSAAHPKGEPLADYDFTWLWQELGLLASRR